MKPGTTAWWLQDLTQRPLTSTEQFSSFSVPWSASSSTAAPYLSLGSTVTSWTNHGHRGFIPYNRSHQWPESGPEAKWHVPVPQTYFLPERGSLIQTGRELASANCHPVNNSASLLARKTQPFWVSFRPEEKPPGPNVCPFPFICVCIGSSNTRCYLSLPAWPCFSFHRSSSAFPSCLPFHLHPCKAIC